MVGGLCQVDNCGGETPTYGVSEGQSCQQTAVNGTRSVFHGLLDVNPSPEDPGWLSCPCSILDLRARLGPAEEHSSAAGGNRGRGQSILGQNVPLPSIPHNT